jgi:methylglutaconyl-CoA hydratase
VRVIVLAGRGKSFCAGADVDSMKRQGEAQFEENLANARELAEMFRTIASSHKPTIARVSGAAIGGGLGLVSVCDVAVASKGAIFSASEVRLGLIPATIAPYVVRAMGARKAKRLFLSGERFSALQAEKVGLVHEVVEPFDLDVKVHTFIEDLLNGAPHAQAAVKELVDAVAERPINPELIEDTAVRIAKIRSTVEAREGLNAFLEKRPASWVPHV